MAPRSALDIVEGWYVGQVVLWMHRHGLFVRLADGEAAAAIADGSGYDQTALMHVLRFVEQRTGLIREVTADSVTSYEVDPTALDPAGFAAPLDLYLGGYGDCLRQIDRALRSPESAGDLVDQSGVARAFSRVSQPSFPVAADVVERLEPGCVVDLGCGTASLAVALARSASQPQVIGIESNPVMVKAARRRVAQEGLEDRVQVVEGDAAEVGGLLDDATRDRVDVVHCASLLNAFPSRAGAVGCLQAVARAFPDRVLVACDYYGKLAEPGPSPADQRTALHDLAQVLSAQGTPPGDLAGWQELYEQAGVVLLHGLTGRDNGLDWFTHIVALPANEATRTGTETIVQPPPRFPLS